MKISFYSVSMLLLLATQSFSQNGEKNFIDQPYVEVSGHFETEIVPNEIYLRIILDENDKKGRISIEKQETAMISKLTKLGIDIDKQLSIEDFDGFYKRKFLADNELSKTKRYQLLVNDGKTLGIVFQALDEIDVSNISIIKVDHSDIENIKSDTKLKALKDAKQKAENYASAIDQNIGKALFIQESSHMSQVSNLYFNESNMKRYVADEAINDLDFKKIVITENVLARFILN